MKQRILSPYLEQRILSASPLELITLSYQAAIRAVRDARTYLAERNIGERARAVGLAYGIVAELYRALDFKAGSGEMSRELGRLYDYMMRRLLEANAQQSDEPLADVLGILCSLAEAWEQIGAARKVEPQASMWPTVDLTSATASISYSVTC